MGLSDDVIQRVQSTFGVRCSPHLVPSDLSNEYRMLDVGCIEFDLPDETETIDIVRRNYTELVLSAKGLSPEELGAQVKQAFPLIGESLLDAEVVDDADLYDPSLGVNILMSQVRQALSDYPVFVYRGKIDVSNPVVARAAIIVIAPIVDQFESLMLEQTNGANYGYLPKDVVHKMRELDAKYGVDIVGVGFDAVEFLLKQIPTDSQTLGKWLTNFCPDFDSEYPNWHSKGRVALWWD